jgi:outer membrane protein assembly factor BamB
MQGIKDGRVVMKKVAVAVLALVLGVEAGLAVDSLMFRGPTRDGKYPEKNLLKQWPESGPKLIWSITGLGGGWSSAVTANGLIFVTGIDENKDGQLQALDSDGKPKWKVNYGKEGDGGGHPGARTAPTVDGDHVYIMSCMGRLMSFEAQTGKKLLDIDTFERFKGKQIQWSIAESVLIDGNNVICTPGGPDASIVALNKNTGETVWTTKGLGDPSCYCSANIVTVGGKRLLITQVKESVVGVDPANGAVLWKHELKHPMGIKPITPAFGDGMVYATAGRGAGGIMLQLSADGASANLKWENKDLDGFHHGVIFLNGHIYGTGQKAMGLVCLGAATGNVKWVAKETGMGAIVYADDMLYVYSEKGTMRLIKPDLAAFSQVSSFKVTEGAGEHWAHPTISNGRMYIRHGDALMAYDISAGGAPAAPVQAKAPIAKEEKPAPKPVVEQPKQSVGGKLKLADWKYRVPKEGKWGEMQPLDGNSNTSLGETLKFANTQSSREQIMYTATKLDGDFSIEVRFCYKPGAGGFIGLGRADEQDGALAVSIRDEEIHTLKITRAGKELAFEKDGKSVKQEKFKEIDPGMPMLFRAGVGRGQTIEIMDFEVTTKVR